MAEDFYNWDKHWSVYDANAQTNPAHLFRLKLISEMIQSLPGDRLVGYKAKYGQKYSLLQN